MFFYPLLRQSGAGSKDEAVLGDESQDEILLFFTDDAYFVVGWGLAIEGEGFGFTSDAFLAYFSEADFAEVFLVE